MKTSSWNSIRIFRRNIEFSRVFGVILDSLLVITIVLSYFHLELNYLTGGFMMLIYMNITYSLIFSLMYLFYHASIYKFMIIRLLVDITAQILHSRKKIQFNNVFLNQLNVNKKIYLWEFVRELDDHPLILDEPSYSSVNNHFQPIMKDISKQIEEHSIARELTLISVLIIALVSYILFLYMFYLFNDNIIRTIPIIFGIIFIRFVLVNIFYYFLQMNYAKRILLDNQLYDILFLANTKVFHSVSLLIGNKSKYIVDKLDVITSSVLVERVNLQFYIRICNTQ